MPVTGPRGDRERGGQDPEGLEEEDAGQEAQGEGGRNQDSGDCARPARTQGGAAPLVDVNVLPLLLHLLLLLLPPSPLATVSVPRQPVYGYQVCLTGSAMTLYCRWPLPQVARIREAYASGKGSSQLWWVHAHSVHQAPQLTYGTKKRSVGFNTAKVCELLCLTSFWLTTPYPHEIAFLRCLGSLLFTNPPPRFPQTLPAALLQDQKAVQQWMTGAKNKEKAKRGAKMSVVDKDKMVSSTPRGPLSLAALQTHNTFHHCGCGVVVLPSPPLCIVPSNSPSRCPLSTPGKTQGPRGSGRQAP